MPKWGLAMQEGTVVHWWKEIGAQIAEGEELVDIETPKITNVFESPQSGTLRRITAHTGETLPVGALLGVMAEDIVPDSEIDAFIANFQANFVPGEEEAEGTGALSLSTVTVDGRSIRVGRTGAGQKAPIVLIHGYSGDLNNWLFNIEALAAEAPVIAIDLPGHGQSSKDVGDGSLAFLADSVAKTLDALNIQRANLVGHSLGGTVAARLAADHPERVASLTLIAPASLPGTHVSEEFLTGIAESQRARDLKPYLEMLFADPSLVSKDMIDEMVKYKRLDGVEDALVKIRDRLLGEEDRTALETALKQIPKATVIASHNDRIVGAPSTNLPDGLQIHWIDAAGHMPQLEAATEVNQLIVQNLAT
jgi:pyruvate dehydrogenase E2 component (dihydrolipoamide acetyltransferase)